MIIIDLIFGETYGYTSSTAEKPVGRVKIFDAHKSLKI